MKKQNLREVVCHTFQRPVRTNHCLTFSIDTATVQKHWLLLLGLKSSSSANGKHISTHNLLAGSSYCSSNPENKLMKLSGCYKFNRQWEGECNSCYSKVQVPVPVLLPKWHIETSNYLQQFFSPIYVYLILYWWIIALGMKWLKIPWRAGCLLFWENHPKPAAREPYSLVVQVVFGNMSVGGSLRILAFPSTSFSMVLWEGPVGNWKSPCA